VGWYTDWYFCSASFLFASAIILLFLFPLTYLLFLLTLLTYSSYLLFLLTLLTYSSYLLFLLTLLTYSSYFLLTSLKPSSFLLLPTLSTDTSCC
jgi:hypothetical protein